MHCGIRFPILIVEDNRARKVLIASILARHGFTMEFVDSEPDVYEAFAARRYLLLLIDCRVRETDLLRIVRTIRDIESRRRLYDPNRVGHMPIATLEGEFSCRFFDAVVEARCHGPICDATLVPIIRQWAKLDNALRELPVSFVQ